MIGNYSLGAARAFAQGWPITVCLGAPDETNLARRKFGQMMTVLELSHGARATLRASRPLEGSGNAILTLRLLCARRSGEPLRVSGISPRLARAASEIQGIFRLWLPEARRVELELEEELPPATSGNAVFFSGGIDSFYTFLSASDTTHLVFVIGFDSRLNDESLRSQVLVSLTKVADGLKTPGPSTMGENALRAIYLVVRALRPLHTIETGVADGVSSAHSLQALSDNRSHPGILHSIDLTPADALAGQRTEVAWKPREPRSRLGSGWVVPDRLRPFWDLRLGDTHRHLPSLVSELPSIDLFLHDSDHSFECQMFGYRAIWPKLRQGGSSSRTMWARARSWGISAS